MTKSVGVHEAKTQLSRLLADVAKGEDVVIANRGRPVARLVPIVDTTQREFGADRGVITIFEDFDAPLSPEMLAAFEA